ncbi:hypothetical protein [Pseudomonas syringae]|uniref:hypothetical protein n=1 Tax=Pseudomonas syringae TaxID=317 RepID=UPI000BB5F125|nr:hypothetical protein [Pseudomonas syringae]PBP44203.1 hypothetical protein CCL13_17000 [Pseudomonas syringae]
MDETLKWIGVISGIVFGCGGGAFAYLQYSSQQSREIGRIEADNTYLRDQAVQLKQENAKLRSDFQTWEMTYRRKEDELASVKSSLASAQADECDKIWRETLNLENTLSWATIRNFSEETRQELRTEISDHKKTHQVCLASRK